ncbi:MAG: hypothetical protein NC902_03955 [Candidatus Omnitrophica bacterium]|nr:hypothetical protein [Candidatus Omnitrophota bacterium]
MIIPKLPFCFKINLKISPTPSLQKRGEKEVSPFHKGESRGDFRNEQTAEHLPQPLFKKEGGNFGLLKGVSEEILKVHIIIFLD